MLKTKKIILLALMLVLVLPGISQAVTVTAGDGSGDDKQINNALREVDQAGGGTVTLTGSFILWDSLEVGSNTILEGDPGAVLKLGDHAGWEAWKPLIKVIGKENVIIRNLEIDGNSDNNQDVGKKTVSGKAHGAGFYNHIQAVNCENLEVCNLYMHDGLCDGLRATNCINVLFHDNEVYKLGHDAFFFIRSEGAEAYGNKITPRTNSAFRLWDSSHVRIYDNLVTGFFHWSAGNAAIQIEDSQGEMQDIEVCNNQIYNSYGAGMWLISYGKGASNTQGINIHNNLFSGCGAAPAIPYTSGITINGVKGTVIKNNVFDGSHNAAVLVLSGGSGTEIKDNIITNTEKHAGGKSSGYGVENSAGTSLSIMDNCFFNNVNDDLLKCSSSGDDLADPKTHVTSSGWIWTGSTWECDGVKPSPMDYIINPVEPGEDPKDEPDRNLESIFGVLDLEFTDSGRTEQTAESIKLTVANTTKGKIYGGVKIVGFKDLITIDGVSYIPDEKSVLVKYAAVKNPFLSWNNSGVSRVEKDINITIENGTAKAVLKVTMKYFKLSTNSKTGKTSKKYSYAYATFTDSYQAPEILTRPTKRTGYINEYRSNVTPNTRVYVDPEGLTKIAYSYGDNESTHTFLIGERQTDESGILSTNYTRVDRWDGGFSDLAGSLIIPGKFDQAKLKVTCYTPYESFEIIEFKHTVHELPADSWTKPLIAFLLRFFLMLFCGYKLMRIIIPH